MRTLPIAATLALLLPALASAESYGRLNYQQATAKNDDYDVKRSGPHYALDLRYDIAGTPFFATAGGAMNEDKYKDLPIDLKLESSGYNVGLGYVIQQTRTQEVYLRAAYSHLRAKAKVDGFEDCCATQDGGTLALGVKNWFLPALQGYTEILFDKYSHHAHDYGLTLGAEYTVLPMLRLYVEGGYSKLDYYDTSDTITSYGGGIKIPFGKPTAIAAARPAAAPASDNGFTTPPPAAAPAAPAAPAAAPLAAGGTAKLNDGVSLRAQPKADAPTLATDAAEPVTLKAPVSNAGGKWWLVGNAKGTGWVLESELTAQ